MLRLTTFGGVQLRDDGEPHAGAAAQRRRLALLVLIASARLQPISRDKLLGYLWAESDGERARHALRQALHALQQALGPDDLFLGTSALQVNPAVLSSDIADLVDAAAAGAHERVVALYRGPFLDGFFVSDAPAFEKWVDEERRRYATQFARSLEALANDATVRGDRLGAVGWWRRVAAQEPVNARYALGLMRALAEAGDRPGAIHFASVHETVVREELGIGVDRSISEFVDRLRASDDGPSAARQGARAAAGLRALSTRSRARDRQLAWLDRTFGVRFDIDVQATPVSSGGSVGYPAFDRGRSAPVEIHLVDAGVSAIVDVDLLRARLDRIASLDEPHIARLLEHGQADGIVYYVATRPSGTSLRDLLAREGQLPIDDAVAIACDVASALAHAHARDVRHGDLRPKHVTIDGATRCLSGLGIAEALTAAMAHDRTSTTLRLGSPAYQSPEQLTGDPRLDARADQYSLGCILYEMLAGEVPFASSSATQLVGAKFTSPVPPLRARRDSVSPALEAVVTRMLARSPSDRFRTMDDVGAALGVGRAG